MLTTAASWSTCVDIGREHSATVGATMNTSGQIAAILMPPIVGYSLKWFGNWNVPFYLLAGLFVMGALCWCSSIRGSRCLARERQIGCLLHLTRCLIYQPPPRHHHRRRPTIHPRRHPNSIPAQ
jgi:hypothetical protein